MAFTIDSSLRITLGSTNNYQYFKGQKVKVIHNNNKTQKNK